MICGSHDVLVMISEPDGVDLPGRINFTGGCRMHFSLY